MNTQHPIARVSARQLGIAALAIGLAAAAGASFLAVRTPYAPLGALAVLLGFAAGLVLLFRPRASLYLLVFAMFVPVGLVPLDILSAVRNLLLAVTMGGWVLQTLMLGRPVKFPVSALLFAATVLMHVVSITWTPDLLAARSELVQWLIALSLLLVLINLVDSRATLNGLMWVIALAGWMLVVAGLYVVVTSNFEPGHRLKVFDVNENAYGMSLILTMLGVVWLGLQAGKARWFGIAQCLVFIALAGMLTVFSGSRGSVLSLAVTLGLFLMLRPTRVLGWYGVLLGILVLIAAPGMLLSITSRLSSPTETAAGDRDLLWHASADLILDHPWGVGVANGPLALHDYIEKYTPYYAKRVDLPSHNPILEIGIDTGLFGMLLYCGMLTAAAWSYFRSWQRLRSAGDTQWNLFYAAVTAVVAGYLTSWLKSGGVYHNEQFVLVLAIAILPACSAMFGPQSQASEATA